MRTPVVDRGYYVIEQNSPAQCVGGCEVVVTTRKYSYDRIECRKHEDALLAITDSGARFD